MKWLLAFFALVAAASASDNFFYSERFADENGDAGRGCCMPTQWEGHVGSFYMRRRLLRPSIRMTESKVGFDFRNKRTGAKTMFYCRKSRKVYKARSVADFKARKAYFIYNNKCKVHRLNATMNRPCIPSSFKQFGAYSYGAGRNSLRLSPYGLRNKKLEYFLLVTAQGCVPVKGAYRTRRGRRTRSFGKYQWYNISTGNSDRSLYNVPAICRQAAESPIDESFAARLRRIMSPESELNPENPFTADSDLTHADNEAMSLATQLVDANAAVVANSRPLLNTTRVVEKLRRFREQWSWS